MPYIDDLTSQDRMFGEVSSSELACISLIEAEVASKLFPKVILPESKNITYFEFAFCNSLPKVNQRGRAFTPKVMLNSFSSLTDQLIDYEHVLESNSFGAKHDRIIGHVKATRFEIPSEVASMNAKEMAFTGNSIPAYGLGALYNRSRDVASILKSNGQRKWKVSMECGHRWRDACFLYENEFIPVVDAEIAMRDCVGNNFVKPYKNKQLAVCLGGIDKQVDYWGIALTQTPADEDSDILRFIGGRPKELASKKIFYMPMYDFSGSAVEVASIDVDKVIDDYASIAVIGETCPDCEGGHTHKILSNMQIMPENGHSHYAPTFILKRGSNPSVSGVTDSHTMYERDGSGVSTGNSYTHQHMFDIPLKGKYNSSDADDDESLSISSIYGKDKEMKLEELLGKLDAIVSKLPTGEPGKDQAQVSEIASLRSEIANYNREKDIENDRKAYLDKLIADGVVLTKEAANSAVEEAVSKANEKNKKELEAAEIRNKRIQKCIESKIDLDMEFEGIMATDGTPMTIRKRVEMIPLDESGNSQFDMDLISWGSNPKLLTAEAQKEIEKEEQQQQKEAASKNAGTQTPRRVLSLAGGGPASEEASTGEQKKDERKIPAHLQGRRAFKK